MPWLEVCEKEAKPASQSMARLLGLALTDWQECLAAVMFLSGSAEGLAAFEAETQSAIKDALKVLSEIPDSWAQSACEEVLK